MPDFISVKQGRRARVDGTPERPYLIKCSGATVYYGNQTVSSTSNDGNLTDGQSIEATTTRWFISAGSSKLVVLEAATDQTVEDDLSVTGQVITDLEVVPPEYSSSGSTQAVAADLSLAAGAGTSDQGDTSFLAGVMGNILGDALTKTHNFVSGVIGALSTTGSRASLLQVGGVTGIVMDGVTEADGAVVAVIDGGDPSSETRANAAFAARMNNNDDGSGVDYGLDLYDAGRDETLYSGGGLPLAIGKAEIRMSREVCFLVKNGAPVDGTSGDGFGTAGPGSLLTDTSNKKLYINTNTKASPTGTGVGAQTA